MNQPQLYLGLMSGTSLDGIDVALLDFTPQPPLLLAAKTFPLPASLRSELLALCQPGENEIERLGRADRALGEACAAAALTLLRESGTAAHQVSAIGSHGQTIRHQPQGDDAFTLQIGDPATIAERTGITTVADFRRRDIAAGGEGAPLVPPFHRALFGGARNRAVVNIGGIANITALPADGSLLGFDTGPGNTLLDGWVAQHRGEAYDLDGAWAASGMVHAALLQRLLGEPFLHQPPPKSTGRELFQLAWLTQHLAQLDTVPAAADVQATLAELTAVTIAMAIDALPCAINEVYVCGGGAYNRDLMRRLEQQLHPRLLASTAQLGLAPEWVEAAAFAWLARRTLAGLPGNEPTVTGAAHPRILGAIHQA